VIDYFLWFMAAHGYTLQRTRKQGVQFADLDTTMAAYREKLDGQMSEALGLTTAPASPAAP
jgi:hypothetical protein